MENQINEKKIDWKQIAFLILISVFIVLLAFSIFYLIKNKELMTVDAISYGMKVYNYSSCSCLDATGKLINFGG